MLSHESQPENLYDLSERQSPGFSWRTIYSATGSGTGLFDSISNTVSGSHAILYLLQSDGRRTVTACLQWGVSVLCRWLAYSGPGIRLSDLLIRPDHSLLDQSRRSRHSAQTTNGDGFGVGWYGEDDSPGVYRDTHPAWNNENFRHLAEHIHSRLFLSHVRAATGAPVQYTNCHPFSFENWLFQHNGSVPAFTRLKRQLMLEVSPELFPFIEGSTDSETLFYLALTFGLEDDPPAALARTMGLVERCRTAEGIEQAVAFSACATDGQTLWSVRYSSDGNSRSQYHSRHIHALRDIDGCYEALPEGAVIVLSEPLDELNEHWEEVPESSLLIARDGQVTIGPFSPE